MNKKVGVTVLVLIISSCVLLSAGLIVGGYFLLKAQKNYTAPTAPAAPAVATVASPQQTQDSNSTGELPADVLRQMDEIQQQLMYAAAQIQSEGRYLGMGWERETQPQAAMGRVPAMLVPATSGALFRCSDAQTMSSAEALLQAFALFHGAVQTGVKEIRGHEIYMASP